MKWREVVAVVLGGAIIGVILALAITGMVLLELR